MINYIYKYKKTAFLIKRYADFTCINIIYKIGYIIYKTQRR